MCDEFSTKWLVEVFVTHQEAIDQQRKSRTPMWLKDALEQDRESRGPVRDSAASLDSL